MYTCFLRQLLFWGISKLAQGNRYGQKDCSCNIYFVYHEAAGCYVVEAGWVISALFFTSLLFFRSIRANN